MMANTVCAVAKAHLPTTCHKVLSFVDGLAQFLLPEEELVMVVPLLHSVF
jgi:hypothetical protein